MRGGLGPEAFFAWCDEQAAAVLDETPIARALGYARNQRAALCRFLDDGRLPLDNNISEQHLRREVLGRKDWLFLGSDEGARVPASTRSSFPCSPAANSTASSPGRASVS